MSTSKIVMINFANCLDEIFTGFIINFYFNRSHINRSNATKFNILNPFYRNSKNYKLFR